MGTCRYDLDRCAWHSGGWVDVVKDGGVDQAIGALHIG